MHAYWDVTELSEVGLALRGSMLGWPLAAHVLLSAQPWRSFGCSYNCSRTNCSRLEPVRAACLAAALHPMRGWCQVADSEPWPSALRPDR